MSWIDEWHPAWKRSWKRWRAVRRLALVDQWEATGALYSEGSDAAEIVGIRDALTELGIPMGYGRVGRKPAQLTDGEARAQFGGRRWV